MSLTGFTTSGAYFGDPPVRHLVSTSDDHALSLTTHAACGVVLTYLSDESLPSTRVTCRRCRATWEWAARRRDEGAPSATSP